MIHLDEELMINLLISWAAHLPIYYITCWTVEVRNKAAISTRFEAAVDRLLVDFMDSTLAGFVDCSVSKNQRYKVCQFKADWDCTFANFLGCTLADL